MSSLSLIMHSESKVYFLLVSTCLKTFSILPPFLKKLSMSNIYKCRKLHKCIALNQLSIYTSFVTTNNDRRQRNINCLRNPYLVPSQWQLRVLPRVIFTLIFFIMSLVYLPKTVLPVFEKSLIYKSTCHPFPPWNLLTIPTICPKVFLTVLIFDICIPKVWFKQFFLSFIFLVHW